MRMVWKIEPGRPAARRRSTRTQFQVEPLEGRALLSSSAGDYVLSGMQWADPGHITYSIAPDGVNWGVGTNNLNATFDSEFGNGPWQRQIALALATWEDVANINIVQVTETGAYPLGAPGSSQGDPNFGDIRFGGTNFNNAETLAQSYSPPVPGAPNTIGGDVEINTAMPWAIGGNFDLYSVMLHETGLALGLDEPPPGGDVVMNTIYGGVRAGLMPGDIAGIQAIYGPRTPDAYQSQGQGTSMSSAVDLTSALAGSLQTTLNNVSLSSVGDTEYFSLTVPSNGGSTLSVTASAAGISLLSPAVSVYNASGQLVSSASNASAWGDAVTAQVTGLVPGQRYYIEVTGAGNNAFAAGAYQLTVSYPSGTATHASSTPTAPATVATNTESAKKSDTHRAERAPKVKHVHVPVKRHEPVVRRVPIIHKPKRK